jgi:hypothetical protein
MAPDTSGSLKRLDVLAGEWETNVSGVEAEGRTTFEWLEGGGFLIERSTVDRPEFPNGICVIGATGPEGGLQQHYFDSRGVARVYKMTFTDGVWTLLRDKADFSPLDFSQRYAGTFSGDGKTIVGAWQICHDGKTWEHDFDLTYIRP